MNGNLKLEYGLDSLLVGLSQTIAATSQAVYLLCWLLNSSISFPSRNPGCFTNPIGLP
jgi:hypothetical protein